MGYPQNMPLNKYLSLSVEIYNATPLLLDPYDELQPPQFNNTTTQELKK